MTAATFVRLISQAETGIDEYGAPIRTETYKRVWAEWDGVKRNEFYQAAAVGLKPEIVFRIYGKVYGGERYVEHSGKRYRVLRQYPLPAERVELVCTADIEESE